MGTSDHDLLIVALVIGSTHFLKMFASWKYKATLRNDVVIVFAVIVGFVLYLIDAYFPFIFNENVVKAFMSALAIPGSYGAVTSLLSKFGGIVKQNVQVGPVVTDQPVPVSESTSNTAGGKTTTTTTVSENEAA